MKINILQPDGTTLAAHDCESWGDVVDLRLRPGELTIVLGGDKTIGHTTQEQEAEKSVWEFWQPSNDPEYQTECKAWDVLSGDGLNLEKED